MNQSHYENAKKKKLTRKTLVKVLKWGLVFLQHMPILAGSPNARVVDSGCERHFGLIEVKLITDMLPI